MVQELREIMAELGFKTINEMVGQVQVLKVRDQTSHWKLKNLDLSAILFKPELSDMDTLYNSEIQDHEMEEILDWRLLDAAKPAIESGKPVYKEFEIFSTNRTVGTMLSHEITKKYKAEGLPENSIHFKFTGTAGQSFGAFNTRGITLELEGAANDYFGKGLSGAKLIIYPSGKSTFSPENNSIIGNVAFYGATSGQAFIRGKAGERFAVRNSGAQVVVESIGDHGCEYMTGGIVVVLGETGRNFAAGMSGGLAFVYDVNGSFCEKCNLEMVDIESVQQEDIPKLFQLITDHARFTYSAVAQFLVKDFSNQVRSFVKIYPKDYKKALELKSQKMQIV
jgi:glutamate synthase (NADPH/NADH) large chain